jgi:hypothetical protein
MAGKKNGRRRNKRQGAHQPNVGPVGTLTVPMSPGCAAFPVALRTKLRYFFSTSNGTGGANQYSEYTWRANSLYDPDFTGVGTQPAGFAALSTIYSKYRVLSATVNLTAVNDAGGSTTVVFYQKPFSTSYSSVVLAATQGFSKKVMLSDQSGGKNQYVFRVRIRPWQVLGITKERYMNDDQYAAAVTANPTGSAFFGLGVHALTISANIQMQADVIYDAVLFERVNLV